MFDSQSSSPFASTTASGASSSPAFSSSAPSTPAPFASPSSSFGGSCIFGQKSAFGGFAFTHTQTSPFGGATQPSQPAFESSISTSSTPFGASSQPAFGSTGTPAFGATSIPAFGATSIPTFGATSTLAFRSTSSPTFGNTGSAFGVSSAPAFGGGVAFGASINPMFCSLSTSAFDTSSTPFGASSTLACGATSTLAFRSTSSPTFGNTGSAFGVSSAPAFGGGVAFGASINPMFCSLSTSAFDTSSTPFGASSTLACGASSTLAFGASSTPTFSFGSTQAFGQSSSAFDSKSSFGSITSPFGVQNSALGSHTPTSAFGSIGFWQSGFVGQRGGSRVASYSATTDSQEAAKLESISAMPVFNDQSHEELRWEDYPLGDKGSQAPTLGFESTVFGLSDFVGQRGGSRVASYSATTDSQEAAKLESISAMPVFNDQSHEELRWEDYQLGDKGSLALGFESTVFGLSDFVGQRGGSRVASYLVTNEADSGTSGLAPKLEFISAMPVYNDKSHKELSWEDHQLGDKGSEATISGLASIGFVGQRGGSRVASYSATEADSGTSGLGPKLESISAMPIYIDKSHEELRWKNYQLGNKGSEATISAFGRTGFVGHRGGSRVASYSATTDSQEAAKLESISAMPVFNDQSHEELRWEDYQLGADKFYACVVNTILDRENFSLEELLDEEEIIQECKALNSRLINFLSQRAQVEHLIRYIVEEAPEDTDKKRTFKFPFIACEIFTCEDIILKTLAEEEELMNFLFSFLESNRSHSNLLAGYFSKVVVCLLLRKTIPFMQYVQTHQEIVKKLVELIGITSIMEVLIRLIGADEYMYVYNVDTMQWIEYIDVLEMIVDKFRSSNSPGVHANAAETLCAIARFAPAGLAAKIYSPSLIGRLFRHALEDSRPKSVLDNSLSVCISLLDPKRCAFGAYHTYNRQKTNGSNVTANPETVEGMLESLGDLLKLLDFSSAENLLLTTFGKLQPPLGKHRLKIVEFISVLLTVNSEAAEKKLIDLGAVQRIIHLYFEYPYNNFLHHHVELIIILCLGSKNPSLWEHILCDCDLVGKIIQAEKCVTLEADTNKPTKPAEGKPLPRIGSIGHLTRVSNKLIQLGNSNSVIQEHLQGNSEWTDWYVNVLSIRNAVENVYQWECGRPSIA